MELLNIVTILLMALDGDMGHWNPDMWGQIFPFGFFYGMPMIWFYILMFLIFVSITTVILVILLRREDNMKGA